MNNAIEIRGLCKHYPDFSLENVSFTVPCGSIVGLVGENGAGKSTTIKAILDLIRLDQGEISLLGQDSRRVDLARKAQLGVVLDNCGFHDNLTFRDIDRIMREIYREAWDGGLFEQYRERFKLPGDKRVKEYSRGMKQKLAIAAALSHHAKLLILDEATSGLDPVVRDEILDLLMEFIEEDDRAMDKSHAVAVRKNAYSCEVLIDNKGEFERFNRNLVVDPTTIEDIILFNVRGERI